MIYKFLSILNNIQSITEYNIFQTTDGYYEKSPFDINLQKRNFETNENIYAHVSFLIFIFTQSRCFKTDM